MSNVPVVHNENKLLKVPGNLVENVLFFRTLGTLLAVLDYYSSAVVVVVLSPSSWIELQYSAQV